MSPTAWGDVIIINSNREDRVAASFSYRIMTHDPVTWA